MELMSEKMISKKLHSYLIPLNPKLGKFRPLFKLHKLKFSIRPIVNCINHPTFKLSLFIDFILQPFVKSCPSNLQDS